MNEKLSLHMKKRCQQIEQSKKTYLSSFNLQESEKKLLLNSDVTNLLKLLNEGKTTSVDILLTYYERAISIGLDLKALAEINIDWAYNQAKECDKIRHSIFITSDSELTKANRLATYGHLFGIPMSLKEPFICKGLPSTCGCTTYIDYIQEEDGLIVKLLKNQGAIPFITSNIPQALLINETVCRAYGRAENPWDRTRSSGGSSGGESALISSRCSPLGLGSDVGGSIRTPCLYTGIYGFKPTSIRNTVEGHFNCTELDRIALRNIKFCCGPLGKSVNDLALMMKSFMVEQNWENDYETAPITFQDKIYQLGLGRKLRIGYAKSHQSYPATKAHQRAVEEAVNALKSKGHEVIEDEFYLFDELNSSFLQLISAEGKFRSTLAMMKEEPPIDEYKQIISIANIPWFFRKIICFLLKKSGNIRTSKVLEAMNEKSAWEYLKSSENQQDIKEKFLEWWNKNGFDAFISPGFGIPAVKHGTSQDLFVYCCYTFNWNILDYPTGAVPITKINKNEESFDDVFNDKITKMVKECCGTSKGMPVGVQVSTKPFQDELCLFVMKEIEDVIKFHEYPI